MAKSTDETADVNDAPVSLCDPQNAHDIVEELPLDRTASLICEIEALRADGKLDAAGYPSISKMLRDLSDQFDPAAAEQLAALQAERDKLADDIVRLSNGMVEMGLASPMVDDIPDPVIDAALHHLSLIKGYQDSIEAAGAIIEAFHDHPGISESDADLIAGKIVVAMQALPAVEAPADIVPGSDVPDGTPRNKIFFHADRIEEILNTDFRTGAVAVAPVHNAFVALKRTLPALPSG